MCRGDIYIVRSDLVYAFAKRILRHAESNIRAKRNQVKSPLLDFADLFEE
jgi:hypothetical protein